jgi:hypothetical protein
VLLARADASDRCVHHHAGHLVLSMIWEMGMRERGKQCDCAVRVWQQHQAYARARITLPCMRHWQLSSFTHWQLSIHTCAVGTGTKHSALTASRPSVPTMCITLRLSAQAEGNCAKSSCESIEGVRTYRSDACCAC